MKYLIILLFTQLTLIAQPRIEQIRPEISKKKFSLSKITGWEYSDYSDKWIQNKNNAGTEMCNELCFRTFEYDSIKYLILTIKFRDGAYKYKAIKEDFISWTSYRSFIYTMQDLVRLKEYNEITTFYNEIKTLDDFYNKEDTKGLSEALFFNLKNGPKSDIPYSFIVKKENNTVRFILPFSASNKIVSGYWGFDKMYFEISLNDYLNLIQI